MGKGDKKTRRGKLNIGSHGITRSRAKEKVRAVGRKRRAAPTGKKK